MVDPYKEFRSGTFPNLVRKIRKGEYVSSDQLAAALEGNRGEEIPDEVRAHLAISLRGLVGKPRGRKRNVMSEIREILAPVIYKRYVSWLEKRQNSAGLKGWSCIQDKPWWQGLPSERAARMTMHQLGWRNVTVRHVQNVASSHKE